VVGVEGRVKGCAEDGKGEKRAEARKTENYGYTPAWDESIKIALSNSTLRVFIKL